MKKKNVNITSIVTACINTLHRVNENNTVFMMRRLPRKKILVLLLLLSVFYIWLSLFKIEIFGEVWLTKKSRLLRLSALKVKFRSPNSISKQKVNNVDNLSDRNKCPFQRIRPKINSGAKLPDDDEKNVKCKQHKSSDTACSYVRDFYKYQPKNHTCGGDDGKETLKICRFDERSRDGGGFVCDYNACGEHFQGEILVHVLDPKSGIVRALRQGFDSTKELNDNVMKYALASVHHGNNFLFLSCGDDEKKTQLIMLDKKKVLQQGQQPKKNTKNKMKGKKRKRSPKININVILFDSISRAHFFRSLQKTIAFLNKVNDDETSENNSKAEILDFELFQSVQGHTTENMYALLNGAIFPKTKTDREKESEKTYFPQFLRFMKDNGYETLYQEDECWEGLWGMNSDLGAFNDWEPFHEEVRNKSNIDDTGLSFACCKMIDLYEPKLKHVFNTDEKTCYNGLNMDTYFLNYISSKIQNTRGTPLFSYTALNIAHDPTGRRVQGLDKDLKDFFLKMTQAHNTITIFFSDHGNTYTEYVYLDIEGRYEMFHPSLFMVVPKGVEKKLGKQAMDALRTNQKRLLNLVDIHHTIKHIADSNHKNKGVLQTLPANRTCADIPMSMPNLCVCDGWDSPVENTTELMPYVEFAVGHINNMISAASPNMKCKRLVPTSFQNAMQRKNGDDVILTFDVITSAGPGSENSEERITVEVSYRTATDKKHWDAKLASSDRVSRFGPYRKCSDAGKKFRFCVCDMQSTDEADTTTKKLAEFGDLSPVRTEYVYSIFGGGRSVEETISVYKKDELGLLTRKIYQVDPDSEKERSLVSATFEILNIGSIDSFHVAVNFTYLSNMKPLAKDSCSGAVAPNSMIFLCTIGRKWTIIPGEFEIDFSYKKMDG